MSSRKEYNLQKGLHAKQLNDDVAKPLSPRSSATRSSNNAKEVARIRETCPPGTSDERIALILQQTKGDAGKVQLAVSELWENHGSVQDEWATVSKKQPKKKNDDKTSWTTPTQHKNNHQHGGDNASHQTGGHAGGRGRGNARGPAPGGRGTVRDTSRGGRGGVRGTGRSQDSRQEEQAGGDATEQTVDEADNTPVATTHHSETKQAKQQQPATHKHDTSAPVAPAPVLHGAWAKKPNILSQAKPASPKKAAAIPPPTQTQPPAPHVAKPQSPKKQATTPKWDVSKDTKLEDTAPPSSTPSTTAWPAASASSSTEAQKWPRSPKKKDEKPEPSTRVEPADTIASWGATLESSKTQTAAAAASSDWDTTSPAWTRSSPILTPSFQHPASSPKATVFSPKAAAVKSPKSPQQSKGQDRSFPSSPTNAAPSTETRQNKFSMGRWGDVAAPELSLQFGSFSMDIDTTTTASANWANTATTPANSSWSPKKSHEQAAPAVKSPRATTSAPPGLTESPKHAVSPRKFQNPAPNAPSPAALPKPEEVTKRQQGPGSSRSAPAQQAQYNAPSSGAPTAQSKLNHPAPSAAFSSPLYQNHPSTYNQYSVGISGRSQQPSASTPTAQPTTPSSSASGHVQGAIGKQTNANSHRNQAPQANPSAGGTGGITQGASQATSAGAGAANPQASAQISSVNPNQAAHQQQPHLAPYQQVPHSYHPQYAPPPPPGMAMPYNPYNYNPQYYPQQGYPHGYYQNPQYPQYSPRQFPPRGNIPYGMDGAPGFSNPPNVPLGYQDPSQLGHPNDYGQGFGDLGYGQLHPQVPHHHLQQAGGKPQGGAPLNNGRPIDPAYNAGPSREHTASPPVPGGHNPAAYGQHYGNWSGSYNQPPQQQQQPLGAWGGHQQQPPPHQQQGYPPHQQQSYRPYNNGGANEPGNQGAWSS